MSKVKVRFVFGRFEVGESPMRCRSFDGVRRLVRSAPNLSTVWLSLPVSRSRTWASSRDSADDETLYRLWSRLCRSSDISWLRPDVPEKCKIIIHWRKQGLKMGYSNRIEQWFTTLVGRKRSQISDIFGTFVSLGGGNWCLEEADIKRLGAPGTENTNLTSKFDNVVE